jgi:hypothetical protein
MDMRLKGIVKKLKGHWMIVLLSLFGIILLGTIIAQNILQHTVTTPIPEITLDDSVQVFTPSSRLDSYKKEMEEIKSKNRRRQLAMEKIIAMDFGREWRDEQQSSLKEGIDANEEAVMTTAPISEPLITGTRTSFIPETSTKSAKSAKSAIKAVAPKAEEAIGSVFYTIKVVDETLKDSLKESNNFFKAVIHGDQKLTGNGTVSLRLREAVTVNGHVFPRNTLVYGRVSGGMAGRLKIKISRIKSLPVAMAVHDHDYIEGIAYEYSEPINEAVAETRDGAVDELLYSIPYGGIASGIADLGRNITRKTRKVKPVFLADGYPVFITLQ